MLKLQHLDRAEGMRLLDANTFGRLDDVDVEAQHVADSEARASVR